MLKLASNIGVFVIAASVSLTACGSSAKDEARDEEESSRKDTADDVSAEGEPSDENAGDDPLAAPDDVAEPAEDAEVTDSGLASKVLEAGEGETHPKATDVVTVHYTGWTTDGERFDSSVERGEPASFPLDGVIAGWTEGLQLMVEGETRRLWIPEDLAYQGQPGRPAGMLVFDVELIAIN